MLEKVGAVILTVAVMMSIVAAVLCAAEVDDVSVLVVVEKVPLEVNAAVLVLDGEVDMVDMVVVDVDVPAVGGVEVGDDVRVAVFVVDFVMLRDAVCEDVGVDVIVVVGVDIRNVLGEVDTEDVTLAVCNLARVVVGLVGTLLV